MKYYPSKFLGKVTLGLGLSLGALASVQAAAITFSGDTTGTATYNRVIEGNPPTSLSGIGTAVPYQVFGVTVDTTGTYDFTIMSAPFDTYLTLHSAAGFNSSNALDNALIAADEGGVDLLSSFSYLLDGMTQYYFVVSGFGNEDFGAFEGVVNGDGTATITGGNPGSVPVPSSLALVGLGIWALRSRQK